MRRLNGSRNMADAWVPGRSSRCVSPSYLARRMVCSVSSLTKWRSASYRFMRGVSIVVVVLGACHRPTIP
jgi:hypothetical protein